MSCGERSVKTPTDSESAVGSITKTISSRREAGSRGGTGQGSGAAKDSCGGGGGSIELSSHGVFFSPPGTAGDDDDATATASCLRRKGRARSRTDDAASAATATTGTGSTVESSSVTLEAVGRQAPKLVDFYDFNDAESSQEFRSARDYLEEFRVFSLDRAVLEGDLGGSRDRVAALNVPAAARYAFQVTRKSSCRVL